MTEYQNLGNHLCRVPKSATAASVGFGEKIFNEPHANVVAHLIELLIDLGVVVIIIRT